MFRQGQMGGHDLPVREDWAHGRYVPIRAVCLYTGGLGCGALVLVVGLS